MNEEVKNPEPAQKPKSKKLPLFILICIILILSSLLFLYWFLDARYKVSTEDAYVEGNIIEVYPKISGTVRTVTVDDTDHVKEGQVLMTLDPTTYQIEFSESLSALGSTVRKVQQLFDQVGQLSASLEVQLVNLDLAKIHFINRKALVGIGGVSKEEFENAQSAYLAAEAEVVRLQEELSSAEAQTYNSTIRTHPLVKEAMDRVKLCWVNLNSTKVRAPQDGFIAKKGVQIGEHVSPSRSVMSVVPLSDLWINANLKEVELGKIRIGQPVEIQTDMYKKKVKFSGEVLGISPGTGSVFSLIPPQNATGNWIKIVQRVPVRISINNQDLKKNPLMVGLSTKVTIDIQNQEGGILTPVECIKPKYVTNIYDRQLKGIDPIIEEVIESNLSPCNANTI